MQEFDLVIVGAGVAGLTAATTAGRFGLRTAVVDRLGAGGQIVNAERIENLPGLAEGIGGFELGPLLQEQAEAAGAAFLLDDIEAIEADGAAWVVRGTEDSLKAPAVILATGSQPRTLGVPGEEEFRGRGVSHCATCDGPLFAGKTVAVVGGGDAALDEAAVLAAHAATVTVYLRAEAPRAQAILRQQAGERANLTLVGGATVEAITGGDGVAAIRVRRDGAVQEVPVEGVFVYIGTEPETGFLRGVVDLDPAGHVATDILMRTSRPGLFAAGDVRQHSVALLPAVAGDGATAAISAFRHLRGGR
ncbi:MAG TPA: FAD-dependent oxidoreductase [Hyphomicrobiales bacterium]|nr:FAD-dependent oxidoreductase [Hyphomicrobiales bacterium]